MFDTHSHINDEQLYAERKTIIEEALKAGVSKIICVGWDVDSSKRAVEIAEEFDCVFATVGIHPENLDGVDDGALLMLEEMAKSPKVIAIGEIGLDYYWTKETDKRDCQKSWFIKQIELANKLSLPVSIHARDAAEDTYEILSKNPINKGAVLHCYSYSKEMMDRFAKLGLYFGFDGPITFKNALSPKECASLCPKDRIIFETDCPYMAPTPYRGKRNEPRFVVEIMKMAASLRGISEEEMEMISDENARRLFNI